MTGTVRLQDRTVVVTGAAGGIGAAIARAAGSEGARVACLDLDVEGAARTAESINGMAFPVLADLTDLEAVEQAFVQVASVAGPVTAVFANAGGSLGHAVPFVDLDADQWHRMVDRNLTTAFHTGLVAARHMVAHDGGAIVFTASQLSFVTRPGLAHYGTAKAALLGLVRGMAVDLAARGVRVNAIAPGPTETPGNRAWFARPEVDEQHKRMIPLGRIGQPEEMAGAAIYLASAEASFTTGAVLAIDGGYLTM